MNSGRVFMVVDDVFKLVDDVFKLVDEEPLLMSSAMLPLVAILLVELDA